MNVWDNFIKGVDWNIKENMRIVMMMGCPRGCLFIWEEKEII